MDPEVRKLLRAAALVTIALSLPPIMSVYGALALVAGCVALSFTIED